VSVSQLIADRYELKDVVGSGGMSSVFCAHDTLLERDVALKLLHEHHSRDDGYVQRFKHEARAVAQLSHPNIVTVIDRGEDGGRQFIVFEYVEGENLKELVERGRLPVRRTLELGLEVARALAFAHAQGLVHRDVKPQNVLLSADGRAKVTDFGIARSLDTMGLTQTGTVLGTSHYIAPEQARGERVDTKTDVYSFGVVLFELLTGAVPYEGDTFLTVALRHVNDPVPSVLERRPDCPIRLAGLIESCMAKDSAERPSMADCVRELEATLTDLDARPDGDATMIVPPPKLQRAPRRARRRPSGRRWPLAVALVALLAIAAVSAALIALDDGGGGSAEAGEGTVVPLRGIGAYDPDGDGGGEHDDEAGLATDGQQATGWRTETYRSQLSTFKDGVGVVLDAGEARRIETIALRTTTPGFTAEIRAGDTPQGPFPEVVGAGKTVGESTTWKLEDAEARYYVVWITQLIGRAMVNEVRARS
jgi:eukaryotic-like serine/threonine-protein kinase